MSHSVELRYATVRYVALCHTKLHPEMSYRHMLFSCIVVQCFSSRRYCFQLLCGWPLLVCLVLFSVVDLGHLHLFFSCRVFVFRSLLYCWFRCAISRIHVVARFTLPAGSGRLRSSPPHPGSSSDANDVELIKMCLWIAGGRDTPPFFIIVVIVVSALQRVGDPHPHSWDRLHTVHK